MNTIIKRAEWFDLEENCIKCDVSYRGGVIKFDVSSVFNSGDDDFIMGTSQNYLGGGIAGKITTGRMFEIDNFTDEELQAYNILCDRMIAYHYACNNGGGDDYMQEEVNSLEQNQKLPISGY